MVKKTGGPAFPSPQYSDMVQIDPKTGAASPVIDRYETGMTIRDYFAGQALSGLAQIVMMAKLSKQMPADAAFKIMAETAYWLADAMIAERERE